MRHDESIFAKIADLIEQDTWSDTRKEQRPPDGDWWSTWLFLAARGAGKTYAGARAVTEDVMAGRARHVGLIAPTMHDTISVMVQGVSGLIAVAPKNFVPTFEPSKKLVTWPNGATAMLFSSEKPRSLRGPQHDLLWGDEIADWRSAQETFDMATFGLRLGKRPLFYATGTPRPTALIKDLVKREGQDVVVTRARTVDNAANLAPTFLKQLVQRFHNTRLGRQELEGELILEVPGALWNLDLIDKNRREAADLPEMKRIVVAIDPAVSTGENADETGIVVCGLGEDGHGYLLKDASGKLAPIEWSRHAVELYRHYNADRIVAEANQGGLMVETTVRTVDANVSYKGVHASRGKITRAEPIASLSEQFKIHHVGTFLELEDQLCTFCAGSATSPDRLDAYVHAMTELMLGVSNSGWLDYAKSEAEAITKAERTTPLDGELTVRLIAPPGIGAFQTLHRHHVNVPPDRIVTMTPEESAAFLRSGWKRAGEQA